MEKLKDFKKKLAKRRVWGSVLIILVIVLFVAFKGGKESNSSVIETSFGSLSQTVKATGEVTSETELNLSFGKQGVVDTVNVKVGDFVKKGKVLTKLDAGSDFAEVTRARGVLAAAEAKLEKTIEGTSDENIALARVLVQNAETDYENTKILQDSLVESARRAFLNSSLEAENSLNTNSSATAPLVSGTYVKGEEGQINIQVYSTGGGLAFTYSGLVNGTGYVNTINPQSLGDSGLYILFNSTENISNTNWAINIPNTKASNYLVNKNAYNSALKTKESAISTASSLVNQRKAELAIKEASASDSDVALAQADVLSAKGSLKKAQALYGDNIIVAPEDGTVTKVDIEYGELASANQPVVLLEDIDNLYVEALINESSIIFLEEGQEVEISFDAINDKSFRGVLSHIDPSATTDDGVVNYKVKVLIDEFDASVKPGMNAEISVIVSKKDDVLYIPRASVLDKNGVNYVNLVLDKELKTSKEVEVTLGVAGDGNMVEVMDGLSLGDYVLIDSEE